MAPAAAARRVRTAAFLLALPVALCLLPAAAAAERSATVRLHDLTENGAYVGCHVTDVAFGTFRLSVKEGDAVTLRVEAPENNTNAHTLTVEGHDVGTRLLAAGATETVSFAAGPPRSYGVLCDGDAGGLKGLLIVGKADPAPQKDAPAPAAAAAALALGLALALARRAP